MIDFQLLLVNEYIKALFVLTVFFIVAQVFDIVARVAIKRIAKRTKTDIDDVVFGIVEKPIYLIIILIGIYLAITELSIMQPYNSVINNLYYVIMVLIVAHVASKVIIVLVNKWFKVTKRYQKTPKLLTKIASVVIYIVAILMILGHFNVELTPLVATLGIGGLAVGLALQNTLANFFAGLHIITDKPIEAEDYIEVDGISGFVEEIGWRSTRLRTLPNTRVIIPNAKLAESTIMNKSMPEQQMSVVIGCGVDYGEDLEKVEKITLDETKKVIKKLEGTVKDYEPLVRFNNFGDSNIDFNIIFRVKTPVDRYLAKHEFIKALKKRYDKEKIEISWPVVKVHNIKK
ncbi:mechanosensitive ion channel family protein [Candidatus Woesearchaeota archaeon]|nr:mechanosensitive ion channel family protein [Candidatus Woesearchaeota archaeon]